MVLFQPDGRHTKETADLVRSALDYDPETGILRWKYRPGAPRRWNSRYAGTVAGTPLPNGAIKVTLTLPSGKKVNFTAHVLAWVIMKGQWPIGFHVDHEDVDPSNNRWLNLREATNSQNMANRPAPKNNTTGFKGVARTRAGKYYAKITVQMKQMYLGTFDCGAAASFAFQVASDKHFGAFARV